MAVAVCLLLAVYGPPWLVVTAVLVFGLVLLRERRQQRPWQLRWIPGEEGGWQQRAMTCGEWRDVSLRCTYLGRWFIGVRVAGHHCWLWPDCAPAQERQALRRVLLWESAS